MRLNFTRRLLCTAASPFLMLLLSFLVTAPAFAADPPIPSGDIRIHYHRPDATYTGWTIYAFDNTTEDTSNYCDDSVPVTGTDTYGAYFDVGVTSGAQEVGLIIHKPTPGCSAGDLKDPGPNEFVNPSTMGNEYWAYSGIGKLYNEPIDVNNPNALLPGYARIHYFRPDGNYSNWSVYAFADTAEYTGRLQRRPHLRHQHRLLRRLLRHQAHRQSARPRLHRAQHLHRCERSRPRHAPQRRPPSIRPG